MISTLTTINLFFSCTPPQQTTEGERIYVFDEQKNEEKIEVKKDVEFPDISETYYVVQI